MGAAVTLSPSLQAAIKDFSENNPVCWDGVAIRSRCADFSFYFLDTCAAYALHDAVCVWFEDNSEETGYRTHCVVLVGGVMVDWTYRQFDPDAAVPEIWTEVPWGKLMDRDSLLNELLYPTERLWW